ncbi:hypothetical protein D7Y36_04545 [Stenotrophomonas maltophilia]|nr:hypothetical protein [Stenotrophomonas maltophilia]
MKLESSGFARGAARVAFLQEQVAMKSKVELIYCVMAVATAVMAGIMKCTERAVCSRCDGVVDSFD